MKRTMFLLLFLFLILLSACGDNILYPICENDKWGYIDRSGKIIVQPEYDWASEFSNRVGIAIRGEKESIIDVNGIVLATVDFLGMSSFSDGYASVGLEPWVDNFINKSGELQSEKNFYSLSRFMDGYAAVTNAEKKIGFIDTSGNLVIDYQYDSAYGFSDGTCFVKKDNKGFVINKSNEMLFYSDWRYIRFYSEGLFAVSDYDDKSRIHTGYVDIEGKMVIPMKLGNGGSFKEGLAYFGPIEGIYQEPLDYGFINKKGEFVIDPIFSGAGEFSEGYAAVKFLDGWTFIDKIGNIITENRFYSIDSFKNGVARVTLEHKESGVSGGYEKFGYINTQGICIWVSD